MNLRAVESGKVPTDLPDPIIPSEDHPIARLLRDNYPKIQETARELVPNSPSEKKLELIRYGLGWLPDEIVKLNDFDVSPSSLFCIWEQARETFGWFGFDDRSLLYKFSRAVIDCYSVAKLEAQVWKSLPRHHWETGTFPSEALQDRSGLQDFADRVEDIRSSLRTISHYKTVHLNDQSNGWIGHLVEENLGNGLASPYRFIFRRHLKNSQ